MNLIKITLLLICSIFILSSCSKNEEQLKAPEQSILLNKLDHFNDSLRLSYLSKSGTLVGEGSQPTELNERWLVIVTADAYGANTGWKLGSGIGKFFGPKAFIALGTFGAIGVGTLNSVYAYNLLNVQLTLIPTTADTNISNFIAEINATGDVYDPSFMYKIYLHSKSTISRNTMRDSLVLKSPDIHFGDAETIGRAHNQVIEAIGMGVDINEIKRAEIVDDEVSSMLSNPDFIAKYKQEIIEMSNNPISSPTTSEDKLKVALIIKKYHAAVAVSPDKAHDIPFIVNMYLDMIYDSNELTVEERKEVYATLSVGAYSGILWNEKILITK